MKRVLLVMLMAAMSVRAEDAVKPGAAKSDTDKMMESYVEQAKPVSEHQRLTELAGPWTMATKYWSAPAAEPLASSGTGTGKMILGQRFLQIDTDLKGAFPGQALWILGFDRRTSEYTMTGFDTHGTYAITAAGAYDEVKKAVVLRGTYRQPPANEEQTYYFLWTKPSTREHLFTLYFPMGGQDVRVAETRYTRD
jgi:hypothetical protein